MSTRCGWNVSYRCGSVDKKWVEKNKTYDEVTRQFENAPPAAIWSAERIEGKRA